MDSTIFYLTTSRPYYRRHRKLPMVVAHDGSGLPLMIPNVDAVISRWGYQRNRYHRPTDAYLTEDGIWCKIANIPTTLHDFEGKTYGDDFVHAYVPISRMRLTDRYPRYTREAGDVPPKTVLKIGEQGILEAAISDGIVIADDSMPVEQVRRVLGMAPAKRGRKPKAA